MTAITTNSPVTATSVKRFPVESITLLERMREQLVIHGNIPDLKLAWKLVRAGILDSLIRFQNCDVLPDAVDFDGNKLKRDINNPPVVFRFYSIDSTEEQKKYKDGVFLTKDNINDILANYTPASFYSPEIKKLIQEMREKGAVGDMEGVKAAITAFHKEHANPDINYGVTGIMVGKIGDNACVDVPLMYEKSDALFERGGTRKGTGMLCFIGGFDEGGALRNMAKEMIEEALKVERVDTPESREAVIALEVLRGYFADETISLNPEGLTPKHKKAFALAEEFFGLDSKMMFLVTLLREAAIISPADIKDDGKRAIYDMLMREHGDGVDLSPKGKFLYICTAEPALHLAMLQKLKGRGQVYEGWVPNQDTGTSSGIKSTKFNCLYFKNGELDGLLAKTPYIKFQAGDDIENFGSSLVAPERNPQRFDSHALIANFNMAAILINEVSEVKKPTSTIDRLLGWCSPVLPEFMCVQYKKIVASYEGREKELTPPMREVFNQAVKEMDTILKGRRPATTCAAIAPTGLAA